MLDSEKVASLKDILAQASNILVLLGNKPTVDQTATALALASSLKLSGKEVTIASPAILEPQEGESPENDLRGSLLGLDGIKNKLGNQNLSVSFPYNEQSVDKVSYHISDDNQTFYLVVKPQKGHAPLDTSQVSFDYIGTEADIIFLVGVHQYEALEHLYEGYEQTFENSTVVILHTFEPTLGNFQLDLSGKSSMSESLVGLLEQWEFSIDVDQATNLLMVIEEITDGFKSLGTTADTFEAVASLMKLGARRIRRSRLKAKPQVSLSTSPTTQSTVAFSAKESGSQVGSQKSPPPQPPSTALGSENGIDTSELAAKMAMSPKKNTKKPSQKNGKSKPGDLNYQPTEGGVGRG